MSVEDDAEKQVVEGITRPDEFVKFLVLQKSEDVRDELVGEREEPSVRRHFCREWLSPRFVQKLRLKVDSL